MAYIYLHIGTDPTAWALENADLDTVAAQLSQATAPVTLSVASPLQGNLVVSPSAAAKIAVQRPSPGHGSVPSHIDVLRNPVLYLPSLTGPTKDSPGYLLDPGTDLAAQQQAIIAAMSGRTLLSIQLPEMPGGVVLLNGAALDFAVLVPAYA